MVEKSCAQTRRSKGSCQELFSTLIIRPHDVPQVPTVCQDFCKTQRVQQDRLKGPTEEKDSIHEIKNSANSHGSKSLEEI